MGKRLYVGNLPYDADEASLRAAFEQDGRKVERVNIVIDRETGRARGFAFVEMATDEDASAAITAMDGAMVGGRNLRVNEAEDRRPGGVGGPRGPGTGGFSGPRSPGGGGGFGAPRSPAGAGGPGGAPTGARPPRPPAGGGAGGARPWSADDDRRRSEKKGGRRKHDDEADFSGPRGGRLHDDDDEDE